MPQEAWSARGLFKGIFSVPPEEAGRLPLEVKGHRVARFNADRLALGRFFSVLWDLQALLTLSSETLN